MKIVFRATSDHLARCLCYAHAIRDLEGSSEILMITSGSPPLRESGIAQKDIGNQSMRSWDLEYTEEAVQDGADIIILDNRPDEEFQKAMKKKAKMLVVIDDEPNCQKYHCDAIVNPNVHAHTLHYPAETELLLGTEFYPLPQEFDPFQDFQKETEERCRKISVHLGWDKKGLAPAAIRALKQSREHFLATLLLPNGFERGESIAREIGLDERFMVAGADPKRLSAADLAIASPETLHELIFFRIPCALADPQSAPLLSDYSSKAGICLPLAEVEAGFPLLRNLIENPQERKRMSLRMTDIIDGMGRFRLGEELLRIYTDKF
jgi:spore coat polysaccharide biosynthesis predicted glycosyltransferase SpsG